MKRTLMLMTVALLAGALAESSKPELRLDSYLVTTEVKDGKTIEMFAPAKIAKPGQVLEYRLVAKNNTKLAVSRMNLDLPVPANTMYLEGTASKINNADLLASWDKKSFGNTPLKRTIVKNGKSVTETVAANEYTTLRWKLKGDLKAGAELMLKARVKVR